MVKMKKLLASMLLLLACWNTSSGQTAEDFHRKSVRTNQSAMWILGSWAAGNMITGGITMGKTEGSVRHFHEMNLMWNTVNLGIAAFGLLTSSSEPGISMDQAIKAHRKTEKLLLINSGLDVVYMAAGGYMIHRSRTDTRNSGMLSGYGKSVMLQGGFLLVFDTAFWLVLRNLRMNWADHLSVTTAETIPGIQVRIRF